MRALRPIVLIAREDERCRDVTGPRLMIRWNNGRKANNRVKEKRDSREGEGSESEANKINRENIYKYIRVHVYIYIYQSGRFARFPDTAVAFNAHGSSCRFSSSPLLVCASSAVEQRFPNVRRPFFVHAPKTDKEEQCGQKEAVNSYPLPTDIDIPVTLISLSTYLKRYSTNC